MRKPYPNTTRLFQSFLLAFRPPMGLAFVFLLLMLPDAPAFAQKSALPFPITSEQFSQYFFKEEPYVFEFTLKPEYEKQRKIFTPQELSIRVQGANDMVIMNEEKAYLELGFFHIGDYLYKVIFFEGGWDGWVPASNFQLNSYDKHGTQIDALILENRFAYEEADWFTKFVVDQNMISIDEYVTYVLEIVDSGDLGEPIENPVPELFSQARYTMENGRFIRHSETNFKTTED